MSDLPPAAPPPPPAPPAPPASPGMEPHVAAALSYLWFTAIIFLAVEPLNRDRFVRFHSFQALALGVVWIAASVVLSLIPILGWILLLFLPLAALVVLALCAVKAYSREWFRLPVLGDWALQQAGPPAP